MVRFYGVSLYCAYNILVYMFYLAVYIVPCVFLTYLARFIHRSVSLRYL